MFEGEDLLKLNDAASARIRGNRIAMIFQEPMSSLNPALTVGLQVAEPAQSASRRHVVARARHGEGAARARAHSRCGEPARLLSAPVLGRHAPARDDRDGARLPAASHHRRRADHRARRHGAGADPRSPEGADARDRLLAAAHHARPRRGRALCRPRRRDVWRPDRRDRRRRACSTRRHAIPTRSA